MPYSTPSRLTTSIAAAGACGLLYWAAFPPLDAGACAFLALVPLLVVAPVLPRGRAFVFGWLAGTMAIYGLVAPSIFAAALRYAPERAWIAWLLALGIPQIYGALWFGVFALGARVAAERKLSPLAELFVLPALWVACEVVRSHLGDGCPWVLLGHSQYRRLWLVQVADLGGVPAVSYAVALVDMALAQQLRRGVPAATRRRGAAVTAAVLAAVALYGAAQLTRWRTPAGAPLRVALIQGAVPDEWRYRLRQLPATLHRLADLTAQAAAERPALVVWPENAVSALVGDDAAIVSAVAPLLPPDGVLLLGAPRALRDGERTALRNSAIAIDAGGHIRGVYDKLRLTPFGETYPFGLTAWLAPRDNAYTPGREWTLLETDGHRFAAVICYEVIYASLVRRLVDRGAEFLVNLSNDGWFGAQPSLEQHFHAALFRAVENRRFLLRATNAGITAIVDPRGAVIAEAPRARPTVLSGSIVPVAARTLYTRVGDVFGWACVIATLIALVPHRGRPVQ